MKPSTVKSLAAVMLTGAGSALVVGFQATPPGAAASDTASTRSTSNASAVVAGNAAASATTTPNAASTPSSGTGSTDVAVAATYADGTWTGAAVDEPWGTFQVQAVVSGGQLTDVVIVSAPSDGHSSRINNAAIPALTEAAVASQGASLDVISGATWTSQSYATSLQAALDAATAAADQAA